MPQMYPVIIISLSVCLWCSRSRENGSFLYAQAKFMLFTLIIKKYLNREPYFIKRGIKNTKFIYRH